MATLTRTEAQLITRIRNRCDQANSGFIADTEIGEMINASAAGLRDLLLDAGATELFLSSYDLSTVAGVDTYTLDDAVDGDGNPLPNDIYRVAGVDVMFSGEWREIFPWRFTRRHALAGASGWTGPADTFYRIWGYGAGDGIIRIRFFPTPSAVHSTRIWYMPIATEVDGSNPLVGLNGFEEYVIADVAAMVLEKEESDGQPFIARRERAFQRIMWAARNLDDSAPERVREVVDWGTDGFHAHEPLD